MPDDPAEPILTVRDLAVSFAQRDGTGARAVDGVCLSVYPGRTLAVVGESGCGKSVTAMSILRLLPTPPARYDAGSIVFRSPRLGRTDLLRLTPAAMRRVRGGEIAMIFQEPMTSLNPVLTVGEQVVEAIRLHQLIDRQGARELAERALAEVGIADAAASRLDAYPHQFSGGMRQRVMIAMALACQPSVILADEPTTALDVTVQAQILGLIGRARLQRGVGVMLITHDLGLVGAHADAVCVMYAGRVVEYAAAGEIFANPLHPYTRGLLACTPRLGRRAERLTTIREVMADRRGSSLPGAGAGLVPWWPWGAAPADTQTVRGPSADSVLHEVEPEHWVGVWRTPAAEADRRPRREPRVSSARRAREETPVGHP